MFKSTSPKAGLGLAVNMYHTSSLFQFMRSHFLYRAARGPEVISRGSARRGPPDLVVSRCLWVHSELKVGWGESRVEWPFSYLAINTGSYI